MNAAELSNVDKRYGGLTALDKITFGIPAGAICGLVGPNGSGKTTTMGVLSGILRHQSGTVNLLGEGPFCARKHAGRVSLMPQDSTPSPHFSLRSLLTHLARLQGLSEPNARKQAEQRLEEVRLSDRGDARYGELSHGMRRRFSIAQALLGSPELIMLDEPTSGLDPELVVRIREVIASARGRATLLVSSHVLSELETLCDYVVFVDKGRCVREGTLKEVTAATNTVRYTLARDQDFTPQARSQVELALQGSSLRWSPPVLTVHAPRSQSVEEVNRLCIPALFSAGLGLQSVEAGDSLEETYLRSKEAGNG